MVSTIDDYAHFATMLMNGGEWNGCRLLKPETVQAMAEPLLNAEQRKIFVGQDTMRLGMSYGHLMSVCVAPEESPVPLHLGGNTAGMASWEPCSPTTLQPAAAC